MTVDETCSYEISRSHDEVVTVHFSGSMDSSVAGKIIRDLSAAMKKNPPLSITVDLSQVSYLDEFGILILVELKKMVPDGNGAFSIQNVSAGFQQTLSILKFDSLGRKRPFSKVPRKGVFFRIGDITFRYVADLRDASSFVGSVCLAMVQAFLNPRRIRTDDTLLYMQRVGVDGLPIVA
ncbi:MAG TPA: STAS domain-containing protein, partial [Deltaproteobacteria bacterium]|nr:STAS domain-containing protein [Deltaproteobacteria bacterium]